jgi:ABC-type transport system involved in cytochrome bd biosynthesis fused ATPase/permease subunit
MTSPPSGAVGSARPAGLAPPRVDDISVGELIGDLTQDVSTLMRQELELAKAELKQEAVKTGRAASMLGAAGLASYTFLLFLSLALAVGLGQVMHVARAMLIVAGIWALVAALLYSAGRRHLRQVHPKPQRTVATLKEVPDAMRGR